MIERLHKTNYFLCFILFFLCLLNSCEKKSPTEPKIEEPKGSAPAIPSIMQLIPTAQEPNRGMFLMIYDASDNEEGFDIERKTFGGTFSHLTNLPANTETYVDWGVEMSTAYTYRIRAFNKFGNSNWSSEKTETSEGPMTGHIFPVYNIADTYVKKSNPNKNYGNEKSLYISIENNENNENILLLFSLPNLPSHAIEFKSAYLRLCEAGGGNTIYPGLLGIYAAPILDQWNENSVTWNNLPGTWLSTYGYAVHDPNKKSFVDIVVSKVVLEWYSGIRPNRGFMLFCDNNYCCYYSKEGYQSGSACLEIDYIW